MQPLTGIQYLKAEIACFHKKAMEKKTWNERLAHFETIDLADPKTFKHASNPIGLRSASLALRDALEGKETGYGISLDASSSGLQLLSMLVSCPQSFSLCGGNHNECVDSYVKIYDAMNLHGVIDRAKVKDAIMTAFYGSTATPEHTFGESIQIFYDTITAMAPGAWALNQELQQLWDLVPGSTYTWTLPDNSHAQIEAEDTDLKQFTFLDVKYDLPVKVKRRPDFHKGLGPNANHSVDGLVVREMGRRCMHNTHHTSNIMMWICDQTEPVPAVKDKHAKMVATLWGHYKESGFLSARILEHIRIENLGLIDDHNKIADMILSLPAIPFEVISVHDCFKCHPNYGTDLREQYNIILADINDSNLLQFMARQLIQDPNLTINKVSKIDRQVILNSNYALT